MSVTVSEIPAIVENIGGTAYLIGLGEFDNQEQVAQMVGVVQAEAKRLGEMALSMEQALKNVRMLAAMRQRRGFQDGDADHLLRFCAEAGVVAQIMRLAASQSANPKKDGI